MPAVVFTEEFTDTNGNAWNATRWPTTGVGGTGAVLDIQSNEGRMKSGNLDGNDYASAAANTDTAVVNASVLLYIDPNAPGTGNRFVYICLRSSGDVQPTLVGRPTDAYYWRIDVTSDTILTQLYRRIANGESSLAEGDNSRITANVPLWARFEAEDNGANVDLRCKAWDDGESEPGTWDVEHSDASPGILLGDNGVFQLVSRNLNSNDNGDPRIDHIEFTDLDASGETADYGRTIDLETRQSIRVVG
jgi:hypothetical protein